MQEFVEKIKHNPCLWNTSDMSYRDIGKKDLAWEDIARECGIVNGREAKSQWKKLRDSHREALRRRKTSTGQPVQNLRPWKYEALMEFILPQTENRETFSNVSNVSQDASDTNDLIESPPPPSEPLFPSSSSPVIKKMKKKATTNFTEVLHEREKRRKQRETEQDDLRKKLIDINRVPDDALSNLFTSLCQKTRELPRFLQIRVEREIFNSVTRAEEEAMSLDSMNTYHSPSSSMSSYAYATTYQASPLPDARPVADTSPIADNSPISLKIEYE